MFQTFNLLVLLALIATTSAGKVSFKDCGTGSMKDVELSNCEGEMCVLTLGTQTTMKVTFTAPDDFDSLDENIKGVVRGKELPFPEPKKDPCIGIVGGCPLKKGQTYQFKTTFEVKPFYPAIPIQVKYAVTDKSGQKSAFCFIITGKIIDPNPRKSRRRGNNQSG